MPVQVTPTIWARSLAAMFVLCGSACHTEAAWSGELGRADFAVFEQEVYPVLMRDCGFANCHGVEQRPFQVWGPGRSRLNTRATNIVEQERLRTYARALSMLYTDGSRAVSESPLLVKPLALSAGGATHGGADRYGRNIYRSRDELGFQVLSRWAQSSMGAAGSGGSQR